MRTIAAVMAIWALAGIVNAWAQRFPGPTGFNSTVGGIAGGGKTWDDESQIGTGFLAGFRADRRLFHNTFAEISIWTISSTSGPDASAPTGGPSSSPDRSCSALVVAPHSPTCWVAWRWRDTAGRSDFRELNLVSSTKGTSAGVAFGGGVAVRVGTRFEVGPEARFLILSSNGLGSCVRELDWGPLRVCVTRG